MKKKYLVFCRVSTKGQEREGVSLETQQAAIMDYAKRHSIVIDKVWITAETAYQPEKRDVFMDMINYAQQHSKELEGILFHSLDRAWRNDADKLIAYNLQCEFGIKSIFVTEPSVRFGNASDTFMLDVLTATNKFSSASTSDKVTANLKRLATVYGRFTGKAPYGYQNFRIDGKAKVKIHPEEGDIVRRIFELYAFHGHTLDSLWEKLVAEGLFYCSSQPRFTRSNIAKILKNRSYLGEVPYHDEWYPGTHPPLIDVVTFDRVQTLLGNKIHRSHKALYGSELIKCAHCGHPITAEIKTKKTKKGEVEYVYYRCAKYNRKGHPRRRLKEKDIDKQIIAFFKTLKIEDKNILRWCRRVLLESNKAGQKAEQMRSAELKRKHSVVTTQEDNLLNLRLADEIDETLYARKSQELRDRRKHLELEIEACGRQRDEKADLAIKAFELSQALESKWLNADYDAKRRILEILCLNFSLDGVTLVPAIRKPFNMIAEGLSVHSGRGERI